MDFYTDFNKQKDWMLTNAGVYFPDVKAFSNWCEIQDYEMNLWAFRAFIEYRQKEGYSASSVRRYFYGVKKTLREWSEVCSVDNEDERRLELYDLEVQSQKVKKPRAIAPAVKPEKIFTREEVRQMCTESSVHIGLFIEFMYSTGCRISEMIGIRKRNISLVSNNKYAIRILGKGRKERTVYINSGLERRIRNRFKGKEFLFETSNNRPYVKTAISEPINKAGWKILNRRVTTHCFRHSFITEMIRETHKITAVSRYAGHSDLSTTLNAYNQEGMEIEDLDAVYLWGGKGKHE